MDTFGRIPAPGLIAVHMDPPGPTPSVTAHSMLAELPADAVDAFLGTAAVPGLFFSELRHLGGAITRRPADAGAVGAVAGSHLMHTVAMVPVPAALPGADAAVRAGVAALDPWRADALALTFVDGGRVDRAPGFGAAAGRLRELKRRFDPNDVFAAAHAV